MSDDELSELRHHAKEFKWALRDIEWSDQPRSMRVAAMLADTAVSTLDTELGEYLSDGVEG